MHEIVVLSGKGGAGKTSVTAALARAMSAREKIVVCDYDVDAPDLHILLKPETEMRADFGLSRYQASVLMSFQFNKRAIQNLVLGADAANAQSMREVA